MNANPKTNHSFTEGAEYYPDFMHPKPITPEYLLKNGFQQVDDTLYHFRIENGNMTALILSVDIISPAIGYMVGIRNERDGKYSILSIETEPQLNKLINALQGK